MKHLNRQTRFRLQMLRAFRWIALAAALLVALVVFVLLGLTGPGHFYGDLGSAVALLAVIVAGGALLMDRLDN